MFAPTPARAAPLFAALGDKTRLRIVARLCEDGPLSIARLTEGSKISRQAVTKHLMALTRSGIVRSDLAGRERIFRLETKRLRDVRGYLDEISVRWDQALGRLRAFVEADDT